MRIVAGRHRGRRLAAPEGRDVRPTSDRTRQAVFNILEHGVADFRFDGARVVDAFAGTGALGLEALSRGAAHATFLERDPAAARCLADNIQALGEGGRSTLLRADATHPPRAGAPCGLVLLDPPYERGLAPLALAALATRGWLADDAVAVVELGAAEGLDDTSGFTRIDERRYGAARVVFLRYQGHPAESDGPENA
jgi:16S rRNA (guanine966-N2)-methyltransferase